MASSPRTPRHSRHSSSINFDFNDHSQRSSPVRDRRMSRSSIQEPSTPLHNNLDMNIFSSGAPQENGLGNLADELAGFEDDGDDDYYEEEDGTAADEEMSFADPSERREDQQQVEGVGDSGVELASPPGARKDTTSLSPTNGVKGHRRTESRYDGSEYGNGSESDLDSPGMPPSLIAKIDAVESLARRGTESNGSAADGVVTRVIEGLQDLGSQAGVEGGASRLITAHSALITHLSHQTRQIHNLTFPILSPLVAPPDPETIDELIPILLELSDSMPRPTTSALTGLAALHTLTAELVQTLSYLSDNLHMSRQTITTATRRLKSSRELVAEMKREEELREEGERWLSKGNWSEKLQKRECAHVCGEVVGGFEEVCNTWRARLLASAGEAQA